MSSDSESSDSGGESGWGIQGFSVPSAQELRSKLPLFSEPPQPQQQSQLTGMQRSLESPSQTIAPGAAVLATQCGTFSLPTSVCTIFGIMAR